MSPTRIYAKLQSLHFLKQHLHFGSRADADAHEPWSEVLAALAQQNPVAFQTLKQSRAARSKISQQKIPRAGERLDAQTMQFRLKPGAQATNFAHIAADRAAIPDCGLCRH